MPIPVKSLMISWRTIALSLLLSLAAGLTSIAEPIDRVLEAFVGSVAWRPVTGDIVMVELDGRPHWGKLHRRTPADLAPVYPRWDEFQELRARLDPSGVFQNAALDRVLGPLGG